jgi:hypothetical protein
MSHKRRTNGRKASYDGRKNAVHRIDVVIREVAEDQPEESGDGSVEGGVLAHLRAEQ